METKMMYEFAVSQIAWYNRQTEFCKRQIEWCNKELKRERANDKEISKYALETEPNNPITVKLFSGNYIGTETRKLINERAKYYREIKRNAERITHYKREAEKLSKYL